MNDYCKKGKVINYSYLAEKERKPYCSSTSLCILNKFVNSCYELTRNAGQGFKNGIPERDGNVEWRRHRSEDLHRLYHSLNVVRVIKSGRLRWAGHVVRMEEGWTVSKLLIGKPTGKRAVGLPTSRWEDNVKNRS